ncbi:formate dehydrogenase accessory sulfurtransferase FdhD [bacterium]|nr:formate dehydrogenase accessory sulfurtransferase FdhD [bacterium]
MDRTPVKVLHFRRNRARPLRQPRVVIEERPLLIDVRGGDQFTIMRTPGHDRELVVGFLFSEGIIESVDDLRDLRACPSNRDRYRVSIAGARRSQAKRNLVVTAACGLCGRQEIDRLINSLPTIDDGFAVAAEVLYGLSDRLRSVQSLFTATGGSHAAAAFARDGHIRLVGEDVGRHNALDKVLGQALLTRVSLTDCGVFLSGRTSVEMIIKAARGRIPLVAAVSAPSARAVEVATKLRIILCGFVRGQEFTVYSQPDRIQAAAGSPGTRSGR